MNTTVSKKLNFYVWDVALNDDFAFVSFESKDKRSGRQQHNRDQILRRRQDSRRRFGIVIRGRRDFRASRLRLSRMMDRSQGCRFWSVCRNENRLFQVVTNGEWLQRFGDVAGRYESIFGISRKHAIDDGAELAVSIRKTIGKPRRVVSREGSDA